MQNQGAEPDASIHMFDTHSERKLENSPLIIYRVVFRAFLIKIYVHRSRGIVSPPDCVQSHGYIDLVDPLDGPLGALHRIAARLGPLETVVLQDLSVPDSDLLEAVSGKWFRESELQTVERQLESDYFPEGRFVPNADGTSHTVFQQPAVVLTGHELEAHAYESFFECGPHDNKSPQILQPRSQNADEKRFSAGAFTPYNQQSGLGASPGFHHPQGYHAVAYNPGPPQHQQDQAGTNNIGPAQYHHAEQPAYNPRPCSSSGPAVNPQPRYIPRPQNSRTGGRFLNDRTEQNRINRAKKSAAMAAAIRKGVREEVEEMKRQEALEKKLAQEKAEGYANHPERMAEFAALNLRKYELDRVAEMNDAKNADPVYLRLKKDVEESKSILRDMREHSPSPSLVMTEELEYFLSQEERNEIVDLGYLDASYVRAMRTLGMNDDEIVAWITMRRDGWIDPPLDVIQSVKEELKELQARKEEEDAVFQRKVEAVRRERYSMDSSQVQKMQDVSSKKKAPRSPRVPGVDDLARSDTTDEIPKY